VCWPAHARASHGINKLCMLNTLLCGDGVNRVYHSKRYGVATKVATKINEGKLCFNISDFLTA
jgi:hypothetical protein